MGKDTAQLEGFVMFTAQETAAQNGFSLKQHNEFGLWCRVEAGQKCHRGSQPLSLPHGTHGSFGKTNFPSSLN